MEALAAEPVAMSGIRYWLLDLTSPELARRVGMDYRKAILGLRATSHLDGIQILDVLRRNGWTSIRHRSFTRDALEAAAERIRAMYRGRAGAGQMTPPPPDDPSGVHLFGRG